MISFAICVLLLIYGISLYERNCKKDGLFIYFLFLTNGFHLINDSWFDVAPITKCNDFALLYLMYVLFRNLGSKQFYKCHLINYKWQLGLFCFISIDFILTIILQREFFGYSIKTYRLYIPLLSFFMIQELSIRELQCLIVRIAKVVFITVIFHVSQLFLGIQLLQHTIIDRSAIENVGVARFRNIPYLCYMLLIYFSLFIKTMNKKWKMFCLTLCLISLLISQHRGPMIAYAIIMVYYMFVIEKGRHNLRYFFIIILLAMSSGDILMKRFTNEDTGSDINEVLTMEADRSITDYDRSEMGNFTFRVLLLRERVEYLWHHPQYLVSGIGLRHEDSPLTMKDFHFYLGTGKKGLNGFWEPAQIISVDLAWQTPLMLFGFGGLFLYCAFSFLNIRYLYRHRKCSPVIMASYLFYVFLVLISFKNDHLFGMMQICYLTMFIELVRKSQQERTNDYLDFKLIDKV